jgi:hypothetical protein
VTFSPENYAPLKLRGRQAITPAELTDAEITALELAEVSADYADLDRELEDGGRCGNGPDLARFRP